MGREGKILKAISVFVAVLFLCSNVAWSEPVSYLRPLPAGEKNTPGALAAQVQADIGKLNVIVRDCSEQLIKLRGELSQKKTRGKTALFGAWAERRMLALQDMATLKRWLVTNNPQLPVPAVSLVSYGTPVTVPVDPKADEEAVYSFFPDENIVKAVDPEAGQEVTKLGATHASRTLTVFMSGGKGTRLRELYEMSDERRHAMGIDTPRERFEDSSKPTVPLTVVTEQSPFAYCLQSARRIMQDQGEVLPPVIIDGSDTRDQILKSLRANKLFGFKRIIVKSQRSVPVCNTYDAEGNILQWGPVEYSSGGPYIEAPDGGGGTLMAMGDPDFLVLEMGADGEITETHIQDKSPNEWLEENYPQPEAVNYIQTDMAVDVDVLNGLTGTRAQDDVDVAAMTLDYPKGISVRAVKDEQGNIKGITVGEMYMLGTIFAVVGEEQAAIVEYGERGAELQDKAMRALYGITNAELNAELKKLIQGINIDIALMNSQPPAEREKTLSAVLATLQDGINTFLKAHEHLKSEEAPSLQGNVGAYSIKWSVFQNIVRQRALKPHIQPRKKQKKADGSEVVCETTELFAPDLKVNKVFGVPNEAAIPAKDPDQFVACRNALAKRHREKLMNEYGVTQISEGAVIEINELFRGTVDSSLRVGKNARLYLGGSGINKGFNVQIGKNVEIAEGTTLIIEGNGPVVIEDGVKFDGGVVRIRTAQDGQPIVLEKGYAYEGTIAGVEEVRKRAISHRNASAVAIQENQSDVAEKHRRLYLGEWSIFVGIIKDVCGAEVANQVIVAAQASLAAEANYAIVGHDSDFHPSPEAGENVKHAFAEVDATEAAYQEALNKAKVSVVISSEQSKNYKGPVAIIGEVSDSAIVFQAAIPQGILDGSRVEVPMPGEGTETVVKDAAAAINKVVDKYGADRVAYVHFTSAVSLEPAAVQKELGDLCKGKRLGRLGEIPVTAVPAMNLPAQPQLDGHVVRVKQIAVEAFNQFNAPFEADVENYDVVREFAGNLNPTYYLINRQTGEKLFVIQRMGTVFDVSAINQNVQLLEIAQVKARNKGILPAYWQDAVYLDVKGSPANVYHGIDGIAGGEYTTHDKIYIDPQTKEAWRVMGFVKGEFVNAYKEIPERFPGVSMAEAANAHGEAIAIFGAMLNCIQPDIDAGRLPQWGFPLKGFHNTRYHDAYRENVLAGRRVFRSLARGAEDLASDGSLMAAPAGDPDAVQRDDNLISGYDNGLGGVLESKGYAAVETDRVKQNSAQERVAALAQKYRDKREELVAALAGVGIGMAHNDAKINNFAFDGPRVVAVIDNDTIQLARALGLDDVGDLLRSASNIVGEQPKDGLGAVSINMAVVQNIIDGYVSKMTALNNYSPQQAEQLRRYAFLAMKIYFFELGSRFFADSLVGNKYFKLNPEAEDYRPDLNLYRGEVQMEALEQLYAIEAPPAAANPLGATGQAALTQGQHVLLQAVGAI